MAGEIEAMDKPSIGSSALNIEKLRERVRDFIDKHHYDSALFWADKLVSLSHECVEDLYWYAQTLFLTGQYHRASTLITSRKLDKTHSACQYLAAKCHYECGEWQEALNILDMSDGSLVPPILSLSRGLAEPDPTPFQQVNSSISLLRGKIYEAMDNRNLASECYRQALKQDVYCFEAFELLVSHHMLTAQEEQELLDSLPFSVQCPEDEVEFVKFLYENRLKKYHKPGSVALPPVLEPLSDNLDVTVNQAERHYYNCNFRECHAITTQVLIKDPYNSLCLPLHVAVLVELKKNNDLFYLAHKLVDFYPNKPVAWFAVGCYYFLIGQNEPAKRYLSKATTLDRAYSPAWLAYGHCFAAANEHDQAMAAYFTASQIMRGCHLPVLYIGLEYGLTNNPKLAERFFSQALSIAPEDPFVLHEMGVIAFQNQEWAEAERLLLKALRQIQGTGLQTLAEKWEPLLNNLGHACRKQRKYAEALEYHKQAQVLCSQNPTTYSAIGFLYALMGDYMQSVDYFHKALGIRRDDSFSTTMLGNVIDVLMTEMPPCEGVPDELPPFTYTALSQPTPPHKAAKKELKQYLLPPLSKALGSDNNSSLASNNSSMAIEEVEMEGSD